MEWWGWALIIAVAGVAAAALYLRSVFADDDPWGEAGRGVADHYKDWSRKRR